VLEEAVMAKESLGDVEIVPAHPFEKPATPQAGPAIEPVCPMPVGVGGSVLAMEEGKVDLVDHGMRFKDGNVQKVGYGGSEICPFFLISYYMSIKLFFEAGGSKSCLFVK